MRKYATFVIILLLAAMAFAGCSAPKQPEPELPPPTAAQKKEARASEWKRLAMDVAKEVQGAVLQREDLMNLPIFVRPPLDNTFSQAFTPLLQSALVNYGLKVSVRQDDALLLDYNVQDEVILNASLRYNNRYVMHSSHVAYLGQEGLGRFARDAVWNRYAKRRPVYVP